MTLYTESIVVNSAEDLKLVYTKLRRQSKEEILKLNTNKYPLSQGYTIGGTSRKVSKLALYQGVIFATLFVGYGFYTYARKIFSYSAPTLMGLSLLSQNEIGIVNSSQYFAYAISKFLGGILSDKISAKLLFPVGLIISGLTAVAVSFTYNPMVWAFLWFINGLGQGCGWPACSKLLKKWFSTKQFGTFWSILSASSNVSGSIGPIAAAYSLLLFGWKLAFIVSGFLSISIGFASLLLLKDSPKDVSLMLPTNPESEITNNAPHTDATKQNKEDGSYGQLLRSPLLWIISICYLIVFGTKTALADWAQIFLINDLGQNQMQASTFNSAIESGGFIGGILAGIITDKFSKKVINNGNQRLLISTLFMIISVLSLHVLIFMSTSNTSQIALSCVGMFCGASLFGPIAIFGIVASESFPAQISGASHAVVALAANIGAIAAGWPLSALALNVGWKTCFFVCQISIMLAIFIIFFTRKYQQPLKSKNQ